MSDLNTKHRFQHLSFFSTCPNKQKQTIILYFDNSGSWYCWLGFNEVTDQKPFYLLLNSGHVFILIHVPKAIHYLVNVNVRDFARSEHVAFVCLGPNLSVKNKYLPFLGKGWVFSINSTVLVFYAPEYCQHPLSFE